MKVLGLEIRSGKYESTNYEMSAGHGDNKFYKEKKKIDYIENIKEKTKQLRLLNKGKDPLEIKVTVTKEKIQKYEKHFRNINEYFKAKEQSMFYGIPSNAGQLHKLEIESYVLDLYEIAAKTKETKGWYDAICFLIDEQFKTHTGVFENEKADFTYREQYNRLIFDLLESKIIEINQDKNKANEIGIISNQKKKLVWKANKNSIGTLFGLLHSKNIIEGTKEDIIRGLNSMFDNLNTNTLKDSLNLKVNENEGKTYYDKETEKLAKEWINYLGKTTKKKQNSTTNRKKK